MAWTKPMPANPVVAVAGATGAVGREMLTCLEALDFPCSEVRALASARSAGQKLPFRGGEITVQEMTPESFEGVDIALLGIGIVCFLLRRICVHRCDQLIGCLERLDVPLVQAYRGREGALHCVESVCDDGEDSADEHVF